MGKELESVRHIGKRRTGGHRNGVEKITAGIQNHRIDIKDPAGAFRDKTKGFEVNVVRGKKQLLKCDR